MKKKILLGLVMAIIIAILSVPIPSSNADYSHVIYDRNNQLLSAKIASDGQWRFPLKSELPDNLVTCILNFEDEYFFYHPGVNPISIMKALKANIKAKKTVRGGSTITMQLMRMFRGNRSRTILQKAIELLGAFKLEVFHSKKKILKMWATTAPFGGNNVGVYTASQRYFGRDIDQLSWSEFATLAVLPNNPSVIRMNKNTNLLKEKRNFLLDKLYKKGHIDSLTHVLAKDEDLFLFQNRVPQKSLHLLQYLIDKYPDKSQFYSTIDLHLQEKSTEILNDFSSIYQHDGIKNAAVLIIDIKNNETLAYVGNTSTPSKEINYVDCIHGLRSYGSLLKPFLYSFIINKGFFTPKELVKDIPTNINGFVPQNFDKKFRGVVPMSEMVSKSLNVPAVRLLNYAGLESFHNHLKKDIGLRYISNDPYHHGLSLILGGGESSLWEMARIFKGLGRNHYQWDNSYNEIKLLKDIESCPSEDLYHPTTIWHTLEAMKSVNRPKSEQKYAKMSGQDIAWKTGTSYGHRDAWAIGMDKKHLVAVWVGNESGVGVHNLTGVVKAAPILFRIFRELPINPLLENKTSAVPVIICSESGRMAGVNCKKTETIFLPKVAHSLRNCDFHVINNQMTDTVLSIGPVEDYYYKEFNGFALSSNNDSDHLTKAMRIIYPEQNAIIQIPKKLNNEYAKITAKANVNYKPSKLFWYLDGESIATSTDHHEIPLYLHTGDHQLFINDEYGNRQRIDFSVVKN